MAVTFGVSGAASRGLTLRPGAAIGAGSVPWWDPEEALQHIAKHHRCAPFWPQVSGERGHADMIAEALGPAVSALRRVEGGGLEVPDPEALLGALTPALQLDQAPGFFAFARALSEGRFPAAELIKGQLVGPWTLASALERPELLEPLTAHLAALAHWQLQELLAHGRQTLLMVDEPCLASLPAEWQEGALQALRRIFREVDEHGGIAGLHCCAALDLGLLPALAPSVFHFDARCYGDSVEAGLRAFCAHPGVVTWRAAGGVPALGVLPTSGPLPEPGPLKALIEALFGGTSYLLTTACGLSGVTPARAEQTFALLSALAP